MKSVVNVGIGGRCFIIDDDAYSRLSSYLDAFRKKAGEDSQANEIMDEIELRIAELFSENLSSSKKEVVDIALVSDVAARLGMPDGSTAKFDNQTAGEEYGKPVYKTDKRLYRNPSDKKIAGVCSGLAAYMDIDVTIVRVIFLIALFCMSVGFWLYIIFWIAAPEAKTAAQKCEMRGIPATAENMNRFTTTSN